MENREEEIREATIKAIIGRMAICEGYDAQTRLEIIKELRELLEETV